MEGTIHVTIPDGYEFTVATGDDVLRTFRGSVDMQPHWKLMAARPIIGAIPQPAVQPGNRGNASALMVVRAGQLISATGSALLVYQHYGAAGLMIFGLLVNLYGLMLSRRK